MATTIIYLRHLTSSKNLILTFTLKQSVASNNGVMGQKTLNSCSLYHDILSFFAHLMSAIPQATCIIFRRIQFCSLNA